MQCAEELFGWAARSRLVAQGAKLTGDRSAREMRLDLIEILSLQLTAHLLDGGVGAGFGQRKAVLPSPRIPRLVRGSGHCVPRLNGVCAPVEFESEIAQRRPDLLGIFACEHAASACPVPQRGDLAVHGAPVSAWRNLLSGDAVTVQRRIICTRRNRDRASH